MERKAYCVKSTQVTWHDQFAVKIGTLNVRVPASNTPSLGRIQTYIEAETATLDMGRIHLKLIEAFTESLCRSYELGYD